MMNRKKITFSEPGCIGCSAHIQYHLSRYCGGFKNKKRRKPFRKSDPAYKAPKWCPKRKEPCEYRIYGFADEQAEWMHLMFEREHMLHDLVAPSPFHYKLRTSGTTNLAPKEFYDKANNNDGCSEHLSMLDDVQNGEVIEIDTGLAQYFFYCAGREDFKIASFDPARVAQDYKEAQNG